MTSTTNFNFNLTAFDKIPWHEDEHDNWHLLDALLARYIAISSVQGVWQNALTVTVGNRYIDSTDDTIWEVLVAHTTSSTLTFSADRTANPTYWQGVTVDASVSAYAQATSYTPSTFLVDGVRYGVAVTTFTSDSAAATTALSYDADITAGNLVTLIDSNDLFDATIGASNGMVAKTADGAYTVRTLTGTANEITATNGDGVSGAPTFSLPTALTLTGKTVTGGTYSNPTINGVVGGTSTSMTITTLTATDVNSTNLDGILGANTARAVNGTTGSFSGIVTGATPSSGGDLTTKTYVDGLIAGIGKRGQVTLTDADTNIALATGLANGQTIDGVIVSTGDTILLRSQTDPSENGIYDAPASGAASRNQFYDTYDEIAGSLITTMEGSTKADLMYLCTDNEGGTLETTSIAFTNIVPGSGGTVTSIAAGSGLSGGTITSTGTFTLDLTNNNTWTGDQTLGPITETQTTKSASFTPSVTAEGTVYSCSGTMTITMPTATSGKGFTIIHSSASSITWAGTIKWADGAAPTAAAAVEIYVFVSDGTNWYGNLAGTGYA